MSLYLGRIGRKIVAFSTTNKTAGKILNGIGGRITRESFMLSQRVKAGDNIDVKSDDFYVGERQVLPSAQLAQSLRNSGTSKFSIDNMFSEPENLARAFRAILNSENSLEKTDRTFPEMSKRLNLVIACLSLGGLLGAGGAIYSHIMEKQRIQNMVDPTSVCQTYSPGRILQEVEFEDWSTTLTNYSLDEVKSIMAALDYRFTSGIRRVVLVETMRNGNIGSYQKDTQTISLALAFDGAPFYRFRLLEALVHEIGHHVQAKTIDFDHELPSWEGADHEKFARTFTYLYLSKMFSDPGHYQFDALYGAEVIYDDHPPADPKQIAIMRSILFCDPSPF